MTKSVRGRAVALFAEWRAGGAPRVVTGDEAHRLSGGYAGTPGDHSHPHRLIDVALATARLEGRNRG